MTTDAGDTGTAWDLSAEGSMDPSPYATDSGMGAPARAPDPVAADRATLAAIEAIRAGIGEDLVSLSREVEEIDLLARQAAAEAGRHEERRARGEERVATLERDPRADPNETREARQQLLTQSRRATLFEAQQQLLEGKYRTLARYRDRLTQLDADLATVRAGTSILGAAASPGSLAQALVVRTAAPVSDATDPSVLLRAQEELRREIARQMHDGPAQSLANIALQAEIVLRLASRGDGRTHGELGQLRAMVEHALEATKEFIFDVRPMVLDDLGLVPTLRRTAVDRGRRAGVEIDLDFARHGAPACPGRRERPVPAHRRHHQRLSCPAPVPGRGAHGVGPAAADLWLFGPRGCATRRRRRHHHPPRSSGTTCRRPCAP